MVSGRRTGLRGVAVPVGSIGVLLLILSGPGASGVTRHLFALGFLAFAAVLLAAPAMDPLAHDVRDGKVEQIEGAIGKRSMRSPALRGSTRYYLKVDRSELQASRLAYDAAPDAGYVRAYYLPRTRRLVNLERLPNPPVPASPGAVRELFGRVGRASRGSDPVALAEARAGVAGLMEAVREPTIEPTDSSDEIAGALTREALVGNWTHPLVTAKFADSGTLVITTITGTSRTGKWFVDREGRLVSDATGTMQPADAMLDGDRLTIQVEGRRLTFTRAHSS